MNISFKKWLKESGDYDQGLHRDQWMEPRFDPVKRSLANVGERQEDPMKHTLHGKEKRHKSDRIAAKFGFMKKKAASR